jgi:hypothetical protein
MRKREADSAHPMPRADSRRYSLCGFSDRKRSIAIWAAHSYSGHTSLSPPWNENFEGVAAMKVVWLWPPPLPLTGRPAPLVPKDAQHKQASWSGSVPPTHRSFLFLLLFVMIQFCCSSSSLSEEHLTPHPHSQGYSSEENPSRILYDLNIGGLVTDSVLTYATLTDPVGIVVGQYQAVKGLFASSFFTHSIYFISLAQSGHTQMAISPVKISGGSDSVDLDGSLRSASYAEPSRMAYDSTCHYLFVTTRRTSKVRLVNLNQGSVTTLRTEDGQSEITYGQPSQYSLFAGLDIQNIDNQYLFVTVGNQLYRLSPADTSVSFCDALSSSSPAMINEQYGSVSKYLEMNNYGANARVASVAPDSGRGVLYVAICDQKNVILKVPTDATSARDYLLVSRLLGVESFSWFGDTSTQQPPLSTNGYAQQSGNSAVKLSFPTHLQFDQHNQYLYWSEAFPYAGDFLLGSLAIRRLSLISGLSAPLPLHPFLLSPVLSSRRRSRGCLCRCRFHERHGDLRLHGHTGWLC